MLKIEISKHYLRRSEFKGYLSPTSVDEFERISGTIVDETLPEVEGIIDIVHGEAEIRAFVGDLEITKHLDQSSIDELKRDQLEYEEYMESKP